MNWGFADLPVHIVDRIARNLVPIDRVKLSTCHTAFAHLDWLENLSVTVPMSRERADALCSWAAKDPGMLKRLSIVVDADMGDLYGDEFEDAYNDTEHLMNVLIAIASHVREVIVDSGIFPSEALIPTMLGVERADISGMPPCMTSFSLRHCTRLESLTLRNGLDTADDDDDDTDIADLGGIVDAPALRSLCIHDHRGFVCLCELPDLAETLERLEIIGTRDHSIVITDTRQCRYMRRMRELVLDSVTACTSSDVLRSMPLLEVLDLSVRHPATDWRHVVPILDEYAHFHADLCDAVRDLAHLRVLGCRDICLTHEFRSSTVRALHMSLYSFLRSVFGGLSLRHVPALDTIMLDGAFACDDIDPHVVRSIADFFEPAMTCALVLKTSPHDNVSIMGEFWLNLAQLLPRLTFCIVDADEM
jgi:hypothetical protein